jgi:diguanylate cyclase (GGDEF)-like protein
LPNRREFFELGRRALAQARREGTPITAAFIDLDRFKEINDHYGHQAGDEVLLRVTEELRTVIRRNEMLFRLGGDEFAILVPHARRESVQRLAQRVVEKAAGIPFRFTDQAVSVTLSLGMAFAPDHANDTESLVNAADRALYRAKAEGKNRWQAAEERAWDPIDTLAKSSLTPDLFANAP